MGCAGALTNKMKRPFIMCGNRVLGKNYTCEAIGASWVFAYNGLQSELAPRERKIPVVQIFRNQNETAGYVGYRGVPRWVVTLFGDEVDPPRNLPKKPE